MKISKDMKVGVLLGGLSSEREVSLRSGTAMAAALKARGYKVATIAVGRDLPSKLTRAKIDVAVNALHGKWGEGVVLDLRGSGDKTEITVNFPTVGQKVLLLAWAPLKKA